MVEAIRENTALDETGETALMPFYASMRKDRRDQLTPVARLERSEIWRCGPSSEVRGRSPKRGTVETQEGCDSVCRAVSARKNLGRRMDGVGSTHHARLGQRFALNGLGQTVGHQHTHLVLGRFRQTHPVRHVAQHLPHR